MKVITGTEFITAAAEDGKTGKRGMLPYPAGEYSASVTYTATANVTPFVLLSGVYYVMNKAGTWLGNSTGRTPAQDYATNGTNATWIPFEIFKAVYAEILFARLGLLGSAVFYDEFMFSQYGVDSSGKQTDNYSGFANGSFTPNVLFNLKTGEGHFAGGNYRWDGYGYTYRKSRERILWRNLQDEIYEAGSPDVYGLDLKRGTYLDINTGWYDFKAKLPRPEDVQNAVIDTRYCMTTRSSYSVVLQCDGVIRSKKTGKVVTSIYGNYKELLIQTLGTIESVLVSNGGWEWQFDGDGLSSNP